MNRIDRLFGIVLRLQRRGRVCAQDLARHFEVSERTIYRDMAALNELGIPIISLPNAGYALPFGFSLPPIFFTTDGAGALTLAVHLLLAQTQGTTSRAAEQALAKMVQFRLKANVEDVAFLAATADTQAAIARLPGFLNRELRISRSSPRL